MLQAACSSSPFFLLGWSGCEIELKSARSDCGAGVGREARLGCELKLKMCAGSGFFTGGVNGREYFCSSVAGRTEAGCREAFFYFPALYKNPVFLSCCLPHLVCSVHSPEGVCSMCCHAGQWKTSRGPQVLGWMKWLKKLPMCGGLVQLLSWCHCSKMKKVGLCVSVHFCLWHKGSYGKCQVEDLGVQKQAWNEAAIFSCGHQELVSRRPRRG